MEQKISRIRGLTNEVNELHPLLKNLIPNIPNVVRMEYTHGTSEMGADFVVTRHDHVTGSEEYIGVIAKTGDIRQNFDSIERQIKECQLPRVLDGGKKKITLSEIWIITTGSISQNAKEKIHHAYSDKNVKFIWDERLAALVEKHYSVFWERIDERVGIYLSSLENKVNDLNARTAVIDPSLSGFYVDQDLLRIDPEGSKRFSLGRHSKSIKLEAVLEKERFVFIQAGMGFGKSKLLRETAKKLASRKNFSESKTLPIFLSFRDFYFEFQSSLSKIIEKIEQNEGISTSEIKLLFLIDGADETKVSSEDKTRAMCEFATQLMSYENMRAVFASRPIEDSACEIAIDKSFVRYFLQPLSMQRIVAFVEKICEGQSISSRLRRDLEKSDLFKSLPRSPISAILLARVLTADVAELPSTLPELYSKYLELALGRWDIKKGLTSEKEYETTTIVLRILSKLMLDDDLYEISIGQLRLLIDEYLRRRETGQTAESIINRVLTINEVLAYDSNNNRISFKHRSFMEYMYAEDTFFNHGRSAELERPFDPYWASSTYFYLGRLKDCPEKLDDIFNRATTDNNEKISRIFHSGEYLLAAYQSPYDVISRCVRTVIIDAADIYCSIKESPASSPFGQLPEITLLAVITSLIRHALEYEFFKKALVDAETDIILSVDAGDREAVAAFLIGAVRAGLGCKEAFSSLVEEHYASLPLALRLGIKHAADDASLINDSIKKLERKLERARKGNPPYLEGLKRLYAEPLVERKKSDNNGQPGRVGTAG